MDRRRHHDKNQSAAQVVISKDDTFNHIIFDTNFS